MDILGNKSASGSDYEAAYREIKQTVKGLFSWSESSLLKCTDAVFANDLPFGNVLVDMQKNKAFVIDWDRCDVELFSTEDCYWNDVNGFVFKVL